MSILAAGPFLDWEAMTGQSKFVIDMVSVPIFSAVAGIITNWTGVLMLFAPVNFSGFYTPGLKSVYPFFPRKVQILPVFAPGGILGFQGFIPARAEKMAAICCDKAILKIGSIKDIFQELDPEGIADHVADIAKTDLRGLVDEVMEKEHPDLWHDLAPQMREVLYKRIDDELPAISRKAFVQIGDNIDQLIDIKLLVVGFLRKNPKILKEIIQGLGGPELKFMVWIGLLGFPMGIFLAAWLVFVHYTGEHAEHAHELDPGAVFISLPSWLNAIVHFLPPWLWVVGGAAVIGVIVNIIAIKMVFEPGEPQPRYKYLWKQAKFAKRQHEAAGDFGHALAYQVLTLGNIANELLNGPRGDKTQRLIQAVLAEEVSRILGPMKSMLRVAVGAREFDSILTGSGGAALDMAPKLMDDTEFNKVQSEKIDKFATQKLREMAPADFMEMLYAAIEQDAWLLYLHGGLLGVVVGAVHLLIFGA